MEALAGGWQFNTTVRILSGSPFNVSYRNASLDRDTGPNRPDLIGDPEGPQDARRVVQRHSHRLAGERVRPARA